jgi:hypothetical protein
MNEYFSWSKVYQVTHAQGSYFIFTAEYGEGRHAGIILPAAMDDIWNMAGSRLMQVIENEPHPPHSHDCLLQRMSDWISRNLKGEFVIRHDTRMIPPADEDRDDVIPALRAAYHAF